MLKKLENHQPLVFSNIQSLDILGDFEDEVNERGSLECQEANIKLFGGDHSFTNEIRDLDCWVKKQQHEIWP